MVLDHLLLTNELGPYAAAQSLCYICLCPIVQIWYIYIYTVLVVKGG